MAAQCLMHRLIPAASPSCSVLLCLTLCHPARLGFKWRGYYVRDFADKLGDLFIYLFLISKSCYLCQPSSFSPTCLELLATLALAERLVKMSQAKIGIEE